MTMSWSPPTSKLNGLAVDCYEKNGMPHQGIFQEQPFFRVFLQQDIFLLVLMLSFIFNSSFPLYPLSLITMTSPTKSSNVNPALFQVTKTFPKTHVAETSNCSK